MRLPDLRKWLTRRRDPGDLAGGDGAGLRHDDDGHGDDAAAQRDPEHAAHVAAIEALADESAWTPQRLDLADRLWGEGCQWPGGADEVMRVTVPFGLQPGAALLLLGAGGGGSTLKLAADLGIWVNGYDVDPVLPMVASRRLQRAGPPLSRRATVERMDPAEPAFRKQAFHAALSIEALRPPNAAGLIAEMRRAVKGGGQLAIVETIAPQALDTQDPTVGAWCRLEHRSPPPPGTDWVTRPMGARGFEIRVTEDLTARQIRLAVNAWMRLVKELKKNRPDPRSAASVVMEAELWLRRIHLLHTGRLRVMRWLAISDGNAVG